MAKTKKILLLFLVFTLFICSTANVSAFQLEASSPYICFENASQISPRLTYFSNVYSTISFRDNKLYCQGDYTSYASGIDVTLSVTLEKQSGSTWTSIKKWSRTYSPGRGSNLVAGSYGSPSSGNYRAVTIAMALNSKGTILEAVKVYSRTVNV